MTPDEHYIKAEKLAAGIVTLAEIVDAGIYTGTDQDVFTVVSALSQEAMVHATLAMFEPGEGYRFDSLGNLQALPEPMPNEYTGRKFA